jgi:hypothetical protein
VQSSPGFYFSLQHLHIKRKNKLATFNYNVSDLCSKVLDSKVVTVILCISKFICLPTDAQLNCLKKNFKIDVKIDIKTAPTCFGVITIIRERTIRIFLKQDTNSALLDDGDYTETCWSCFNVNFKVNFKIAFKTIQLCISW